MSGSPVAPDATAARSAPSSPQTSASAATDALGPAALAGLLGLLCALVAPPTADYAAAVFRSNLWDAHGFTTWTFAWYGGIQVPSYSLTFPPLGAWIGPMAVGVLAAILGAGAFTQLVRGAPAYLFAVALTAGVWVGRMPFTLAVALSVCAFWAARSDRLIIALIVSALATATSPLAGAFIAVIAVAWWLGERFAVRARTGTVPVRAALVLTAPALVVAGTLALLFPDKGAEPFAPSAFWPALAIALIACAALGRTRPVQLTIAGCLTLLLVAAFVVDSPFGGNALRPITLLGPPALALAAAQEHGRRRLVLIAGVVATTFLAVQVGVRAVIDAAGDPATKRSYYTQLNQTLDRLMAPGDRVEIPFTRTHWETVYVHQNLARGWLRQLDSDRNALFYEDDLTAAKYLAWMHDRRIRWIAVPGTDVPLDDSATDEAKLIGSLPGLRRCAQAGPWTIYELPGIRTVDGPGRVVRANATEIVVRARRAGVLRLPGYEGSKWLKSPARTGKDGRLELVASQAGDLVARP